MICIQLVELTTWAQFTGHKTDFHCMLINNGALLIHSGSKHRRIMSHASLTYFYWHARLHGRNGKVFFDKTGTLPLFFIFCINKPLSSASLSYVSMQVRWVVTADIVMGRDAKLLHLVANHSCVSVNIHAYQYLSLSCFQYHLYSEMLLGLYVRYGTHNGAIHFLLLLLTPESESTVYIQKHISNHHSSSLNVLPWTVLWSNVFPYTIFKGVF